MIPFLPVSILSDGAVGMRTGDTLPVDVNLGGQGYSANLPRGTTTAVAGTDVFVGGVRYTQSGILRLYDASAGLPAGAVLRDGVAVSSDGQLCITTATPSSPAYIGGMAVSSTGAVHIMDMPSAAWYIADTGLTDAGSGACSAWADQSGNGRNLAQGTAANRPTIQSDGSLLFDGSNDSLQALFTLNQPFTVYMYLSQLTWTANRYFFDGGVGNTAIIQDDLGVSPNIEIFAGTRLRPVSGPALGSRAVVTAVFNGASSSLSVNQNAALTGNAGATNAGGITIGGALSAGSLCSNIRVWEVIVRTGADSSRIQTNTNSYLLNKYQALT